MAHGQEGLDWALGPEGAPGPDLGRGLGMGPGRPLLARSQEPRVEYNANNYPEMPLLSREYN